MWSLYENKNGSSLCLKPLIFSNNKSQEDVVKEIIEVINEGHKVIFIKGVCGTGKSAIALNLAKELGKASIVVPVKALQKQYEDDYVNKKFLLKNDGQKLKIEITTGRANHICPYLQENIEKFEFGKKAKEEVEVKEKDAKLNEFNDLTNNEIKETEEKNIEQIREKQEIRKNISCDNYQLPCKIEIKEKNIKKIQEYLRENPKIEQANFTNVSLNRVRRMSIAPVCPYWSPIVPSKIDLGLDAERKKYTGLKNIDYTIYKRKSGCGYYDQFNSYIDSDVIIFNSQKYKLETAMNRKPSTEIEIIDECDEFLDSFSNHKKINLNRLNFALGNLFGEDEKTGKIINELIDLTRDILNNKKIQESILNEEIIHIKDTKILHLLKYFLNSDFMGVVECDEENYCYYCDEVARTFDGFFDETYVSFHKEEKDLIVRLVTTNLEKQFKELLDKNKVIVMMSGTIHSENVLKNIFGLSDFKIIEAETKMPGKIIPHKTGYEINCRYSNFQNGKITRKQYLLALSKCIEQAKKPCLIHVNSFKDLPTEQEIENYGLNNEIMTEEKLKRLQAEDSVGEQVARFKQGKIDILYSTKCNRGVDFPGETCNSIILTKYPYPNINSLFWKILKRTKPQDCTSFYMDKARREFLQRIYRGLRSQKDEIFLLSPDLRVFDKT
ncbi:MAG TPA: helicase C-terminal domain-containing protein [Candidatus Paceibacterota bacterium]|nr:helicase C-terminal domain-containing protein [Candidatus Paceibacterota bacterium]